MDLSLPAFLPSVNGIYIYIYIYIYPQEDSVDLFRCAEAASFHSPFSVQTRGSVTGDVTYPQSSGLRKRDTSRYSSTSSSAAPVSDECSCSTNLLVVEV